ncbi:MAG: hypothetical protein H7123_03650, partial [Thermoleophilia bacterium]|nr:hypothetical protein [Thermoleophilia bacterium]
MHRRLNLAITAALMICSLAAIAGCGSAKSTPNAASGPQPSGAAGELKHEEGTLTMSGARVELVFPNKVKRTYQVGTSIKAGELAALVASGENVRLFHRGTVAVRIEKAPTAQATAKSTTGKIARVSATSLSLTGADGATDFVIRPADRAAFDVSHLREHQSEGAPITVYFEL